MNFSAVWFFWGSLALMLWPITGYPMLLALVALARRRSNPPMPAEAPCTVSVVVTVTPEDGPLEPKLHNTLREVDWGDAALDVIIVADGRRLEVADTLHSTLAGYRWQIVEHGQRRGKDAAQHSAIAHASGEVIVFTDMSTRLHRDAGRHMIATFSDKSIGCVSGVDHPEGSGVGESIYVRAEMTLRQLEADAGSLIGASGCFFAVRRMHALRWDGFGTSDLSLPLLVARHEGRTVPAPLATCSYETATSGRSELMRKRRTIVHGMVVLKHYRDMLNPLRSGFVAVQLFSHKLLRWSLPWLLLTLLVSCAMAATVHPFYAAFGTGVLVLCLTGWGLYAIGLHSNAAPPLAALSFFAVAVMAAALGLWDLIRGRTHTCWTSSRSSADLLQPT